MLSDIEEPYNDDSSLGITWAISGKSKISPTNTTY